MPEQEFDYQVIIEEVNKSTSQPSWEHFESLFESYKHRGIIIQKQSTTILQVYHALVAYQPSGNEQGILKDILLAIFETNGITAQK